MDDSAAGEQKLRIKPGTKLISIGVGDLYIRANYQDFERYQSVDIAIGADAEATLPMLTEYVKQAIPAERRAMIAARGDKAKKGQAAARERMLKAAADNAWDASPISSSRFSAEIWHQIKNRELGAGVARFEPVELAASAVELRPASSVHRRPRRRRHRLWPARRGGRGLRAPCHRFIAGSASTSRTTAIPCMRRAPSGRRRITRSRC